MNNRILLGLWCSGIFILSTLASSHPFSLNPLPPFVSPDPSQHELIQTWCTEVNQALLSLQWNVDPCTQIPWQVGGQSIQGRALVYAEFGNPLAKNTTLILSMVHGDEITPLYLALQLARSLTEKTENTLNARVIIAPLVNPDGFFRIPRSRMNAHGVDLNRNFFTQDWKNRALQGWKTRFKSDPRRFPGLQPRSEPETLFQETLIHKSCPSKIFSIHSPLNFLDYDGPSEIMFSPLSLKYIKIYDRFKTQLKAISGGYYPGSLGNYASKLGYPVFTAELSSADPKKAPLYWNQYKSKILTLIQFQFPAYVAEHIRTSSRGK